MIRANSGTWQRILLNFSCTFMHIPMEFEGPAHIMVGNAVHVWPLQLAWLQQQLMTVQYGVPFVQILYRVIYVHCATSAFCLIFVQTALHSTASFANNNCKWFGSITPCNAIIKPYLGTTSSIWCTSYIFNSLDLVILWLIHCTMMCGMMMQCIRL